MQCDVLGHIYRPNTSSRPEIQNACGAGVNRRTEEVTTHSEPVDMMMLQSRLAEITGKIL